MSIHESTVLLSDRHMIDTKIHHINQKQNCQPDRHVHQLFSSVSVKCPRFSVQFQSSFQVPSISVQFQSSFPVQFQSSSQIPSISVQCQSSFPEVIHSAGPNPVTRPSSLFQQSGLTPLLIVAGWEKPLGQREGMAILNG